VQYKVACIVVVHRSEPVIWSGTVTHLAKELQTVSVVTGNSFVWETDIMTVYVRLILLLPTHLYNFLCSCQTAV